MWTENNRVQITPIGRCVSRLHRADQRLGGLSYPDLNSEDPRIKKIATDAALAAQGLRGTLQDELAHFAGALPILPETEDDFTAANC